MIDELSNGHLMEGFFYKTFIWKNIK